MSGQGYKKSDLTSIAPSQLNNYSKETAAYIWDMMINGFPGSPKLQGLIPFTKADEQSYSAQGNGTFNTLFGRLDMCMENNGVTIVVGVVNYRGVVIELPFTATVNQKNFVYEGLISFIVLEDNVGTWSFHGWLISQPEMPGLVQTAGNVLALFRDGADNATLDASITQVPGYPVYSIGAPDGPNQVRGLYGSNNIRIQFQLPVLGTGVFTTDYTKFYSGDNATLISSFSGSGIYTLVYDCDKLINLDQSLDHTSNLEAGSKFQLLVDTSISSDIQGSIAEVAGFEETIVQFSDVTCNVWPRYGLFSKIQFTVPANSSVFLDDYDVQVTSGNAVVDDKAATLNAGNWDIVMTVHSFTADSVIDLQKLF